MSYGEVPQRWMSSSTPGTHPAVRWWPWAVIPLGMVVILIGGVLYTPG